MGAAADLDYVLKLKSDIAWNTYLESIVARKLESATAIVTEKQGIEDDYWKYYDDAMAADKDCKYKGKTYVQKDQAVVSESVARAYADAKTRGKYDADELDDLVEIQLNLEGQQSMYEALLTLERTQLQSAQQLLMSDAQQKHMIQGG